MKDQMYRGYGQIDKVVCVDCVGDYALKQLISDGNLTETCDYCGETGKCISVEDLIEKIMDGIRFEYVEAIDEMGIEKGRFIGANTWDTYDLLHDVLSYEMELDDELLGDVVKTVDMTTWCKIDPYQLSESKENLILWDTFTEIVKKQSRYVFFRMQPEDDNDESPFNILDKIGEKIGELGLVKSLKPGQKFYRGRMHFEGEQLNEAKDLSSPPAEKAKSNRMSAVGISIFYGAKSTETAIAEIYDSKYRFATTAVFKNTRRIRLVDLTEIDRMIFPSLFDEEKRIYRETIAFLRELNRNLSKPIERMEEIEYIPAQIIAEYFRYLFKYKDKKIDGIIYNSSKVKGGICYALFFDQEQCLDSELEPNERRNNQMLKLDNDSINICEVKVNVDLREYYD